MISPCRGISAQRASGPGPKLVQRSGPLRQGRYVASEGKESVVAWPLKSSGVLLVGDGPVAELESLKS